MGRGMARNLHRAGLLHGVWNRTRDRAQRTRRANSAAARRRRSGRARGATATSSCSASRPTPTSSQMVDDIAPGAAPGRDRHRLLDRQRPTPRARPRGGWPSDRSSSSTPRSAAASKARATARSRSWSAVGGRASSARDRCSPPWGAHVTHFGPSGAGPGGQGHQPDHVRRHHPGRRGGHGVRQGRGPAARGADRDARQGRGLELVLRAPRAEHGAQRLPARASACACTRRTCASAATWPRATACSCPWSRRRCCTTGA